MKFDRLSLVGAASGAGLLILVIKNVAADLVVGRVPFTRGTLGFLDAPDVGLFHFMLLTFPMLTLALTGSRRRPLWLLAIGTTSSLAALVVWQLRQDYLADFVGGADIGLGMLMMASPIVTLLVIGIAAKLWRN